MASETIFAYVGPKGSGKTHEGTRVVLEQLRLGRFVVAVIPSLDVNRVVELLDDDTVRDRLRVVDYDAVERDDFFPDEDRIKLIKGPEGEMIAGPMFDGRAWRETIVPTGAVVVIDEAWRWLESTQSIPPRFKKALHMARHWRGPANWRSAEDRERFMADPCGSCENCTEGLVRQCVELWHPGKGGDVAKGGDGTVLVSMNILLLTQDYSSLNRTLRKQIDQICDIKSYKAGAVPPIIQKLFPFWRTDGRYSVSTFEGHKIPDRRSKAYNVERKAFEILPHLPEIHGLFEYAGGQALERAVDDRSSASNDSRLGYIKYAAFLAVVAIGVFGYWTYTGIRDMVTPKNAAGAPVEAVASSTATYAPATAKTAPAAPVRQRRPTLARVAGAVAGTTFVVDDEGRLHPSDTPLDFDQNGPQGEYDGYQVSLWSAPVRASGNGRRGGNGVTGPGAGIGDAAIRFADPDSVGVAKPPRN
ncbi:zonular occludens toxin domain-containing protein [Sphingomonas sp. CV7422]|uniref:zonular occludens toxin domain-containing protein n=1 Tax=Sphingomonas sp. CV7422 TaxID=3018036 RepID=UPI0022FF3F38|nr:zonular occludens toxin domain-containing protein [Sphingomonas sp. CV7422]